MWGSHFLVVVSSVQSLAEIKDYHREKISHCHIGVHIDAVGIIRSEYSNYTSERRTTVLFRIRGETSGYVLRQ